MHCSAAASTATAHRPTARTACQTHSRHPILDQLYEDPCALLGRSLHRHRTPPDCMHSLSDTHCSLSDTQQSLSDTHWSLSDTKQSSSDTQQRAAAFTTQLCARSVRHPAELVCQTQIRGCKAPSTQLRPLLPNWAHSLSNTGQSLSDILADSCCLCCPIQCIACQTHSTTGQTQSTACQTHSRD